MQLRHLIHCTLICLYWVGASAAAEDDPCGGFKWDLNAERKLFAGTAAALAAGKTAAAAPVLEPGRLYRLELSPQSEVTFAVAPGNTTAAEQSFAGLAVVQITSSGHYRVSVDQPLWIDVATERGLAPVEDFQGQQSCETPRKVVAFELEGPKHWMLQLSGAARPAARVTVTRVAPDRAR